MPKETGFVSADQNEREALFDLDVEVTTVESTTERNTWISGVQCLLLTLV